MISFFPFLDIIFQSLTFPTVSDIFLPLPLSFSRPIPYRTRAKSALHSSTLLSLPLSPALFRNITSQYLARLITSLSLRPTFSSFMPYIPSQHITECSILPSTFLSPNFSLTCLGGLTPCPPLLNPFPFFSMRDGRLSSTSKRSNVSSLTMSLQRDREKRVGEKREGSEGQKAWIEKEGPSEKNHNREKS